MSSRSSGKGLNITLQIDEICLDTIVAETIGFDEDDDIVQFGEKRVADLVAERIAAAVIRDSRYPKLKDRVLEIRDEEALAAPVQKTNSYGEPIGEPTPLRDLVMATTRTLMTEQRSDGYGRNTKQPWLNEMVSEAVKKAFKDDVNDMVVKLRAQIAKDVSAAFTQPVPVIVQAALAKF